MRHNPEGGVMFDLILGLAQGILAFVWIVIGAFAFWDGDYPRATCFFVVAIMFEHWSERNIEDAREKGE